MYIANSIFYVVFKYYIFLNTEIVKVAGNLRYSTKLSKINYMDISCKKLFFPLISNANYNSKTSQK